MAHARDEWPEGRAVRRSSNSLVLCARNATGQHRLRRRFSASNWLTHMGCGPRPRALWRHATRRSLLSRLDAALRVAATQMERRIEMNWIELNRRLGQRGHSKRELPSNYHFVFGSFAAFGRSVRRPGRASPGGARNEYLTRSQFVVISRFVDSELWRKVAQVVAVELGPRRSCLRRRPRAQTASRAKVRWRL